MPRVLTRKKPGRNIEMYYVDSLTGREITKSSGTRDQREADRKAQQWETKLEREGFSSTKAWTPAKEMWLAQCRPPRKSKSTFKGYRRTITMFEQIIGSPRDMSSITTLVLDRFVIGMREADPDGMESSIHTRLAHIRAFLRWCAARDIIAKVPMIPMPKLPPAEEAGGDPISQESFRELLKLLPKETKRFAEGMWLSGLRPSEAMVLHWSEGLVTLHLDGPRSYIHFEPEGQKNRRRQDMPLTPDFVAFLERLPERGGFVLNPSRRSASAIRGDFQEAAYHVGLTITPKIMRKSFAARWVTVLNHIELQSLMRHKNIATTLKHYARLTREQIQAGVWEKAVPTLAPKPRDERRRAGSRGTK